MDAFSLGRWTTLEKPNTFTNGFSTVLPALFLLLPRVVGESDAPWGLFRRLPSRLECRGCRGIAHMQRRIQEWHRYKHHRILPEQCVCEGRNWGDGIVEGSGAGHRLK